MRASELRAMSAEDLAAKAVELRRTVGDLNLKRYARRLDKSSELVIAKKDLARVLTVLREKAAGEAGGTS